MSAQYPPPVARKKSGGSRVLLGCGIGCLVVVVLLAIGAGVVWVKFVSPVVESMKKVEALQQEIREQRKELVQLDEGYSSARFRDPSTVELTSEDLDRYIGVRRALQPQLERIAQVEEKMLSRFDLGGEGKTPGVGDIMGMTFGMVSGMGEFSEAQLALLKEAWAALYPISLSPSDLAAMAGIVEWRFLGREAALYLALDPEEHQELWRKQMNLRFAEAFLRLASQEGVQVQMGGRDRADMERNVERLRSEVQALEERARAETQLALQTRVLLESRRPELEQLGESGIHWLGLLSAEVQPPVPTGEGMEGGGMQVEREY